MTEPKAYWYRAAGLRHYLKVKDHETAPKVDITNVGPPDVATEAATAVLDAISAEYPDLAAFVEAAEVLGAAVVAAELGRTVGATPFVQSALNHAVAVAEHQFEVLKTPDGNDSVAIVSSYAAAAEALATAQNAATSGRVLNQSSDG